MMCLISRCSRWLLSGTFILLVACAADDELTPEEEILAQLEVMETAAEARQVDDLIDFVSQGYSDNKGLTRDKIQRVLRIRFIQQKSVNVFSKVTRIETDTSEDSSTPVASVVVYAGIARTPFDSLADLTDVSVDVVRFSLQMHRDSDRWMIDSATWHRASLSEVF